MGRQGLGIALVAFLGATAVAAVGARWALERRAPALEKPKLVKIAEGEPLAEVARRLSREEDLVPSPTLFLWLARWRGDDRRIRSGVYELPGGATAGEILERLAAGPKYLDLVSIPEGWTVSQIAARLESGGLGSATRFRELAEDAAFAASLGVPAPRLEGYLFPDTYAFSEKASPEDILSRMVKRFDEMFDEPLRRVAERSGLGLHQVVTLASLIEMEAAVPAERPLISAVFRNRLSRGMRLESDPTVVYGVERSEGPIRRSDLERATPYNTYRITGLPPGPIANPGRASLEAAVYPADDQAVLFFVARNDRTHEFNQSFEAHLRAVERYQRQAGG